VTAPKKVVTSDVQQLITSLHQEDVIRCTGTIKEAKVAPNGFEIIPESIVITSISAVPLPLDPRGVTDSSPDTKFTWRSIDLRRPETSAIFKIEDALVSGMEDYLRSRGFIRVFTPAILGGISEGGAEVFKLDFYGKDAFLRQDPQLHRQLAIAGGLERVYDLGWNWRAELSHTPRHISEHRTIAAEMGFIESERDTMRIEENMVSAGIVRVITDRRRELELLKVELMAPKVPFPEVAFPEIYPILESLGHVLPRNQDLDREGEMLLARYVKEKFDSDFFFVSRFPYAIKPFYVAKVDEDIEFARSVDLVFEGLELSSGGQRESRHEKIVQQIAEKGLNAEGLKWFTEPFRYGVPPHGGFSLGIERFIAQLLNLESVKEAALFPRDPERLVP
jgi:aspartyl/asparaginyl-tRNA synthetase